MARAPFYRDIAQLAHADVHSEVDIIGIMVRCHAHAAHACAHAHASALGTGETI